VHCARTTTHMQPTSRLAESDAFSVPLHTSCTASVCCACMYVCVYMHAPSCCCHPVCGEKRAIAHPHKRTRPAREILPRSTYFLQARTHTRTLNCICGAQWRSARFATVLFTHQTQSARRAWRAKWANAHVRAGVDKKWIAAVRRWKNSRS
jgi:hypothetical protein